MTEIIQVELTPEQIAEREAWAAGAYDREYKAVEALRQSAYQSESDPLFFSYQRTEDGVTKQIWLDKVAEIKARLPYPEKP